jgi:hypothetical protein
MCTAMVSVVPSSFAEFYIAVTIDKPPRTLFATEQDISSSATTPARTLTPVRNGGACRCHEPCPNQTP